MSEAKISLSMIVKDCAEDLERCLGSIVPYVDEVCITDTGSSDKTVEVAKNFGARIFHFDWCDNFSVARNFSFARAKHDHVLWLDSDDTVEGPERLMSSARRMIGNGEVDGFFVDYLYEFDRNNNCTTRLWRERIVNRRLFEWRAPIHECLCAEWNVHMGYVPSEAALIRHHRQREDAETNMRNLERNIKIFERQFDAQHSVETRMLYYWANTLLGLGRLDAAIGKYNDYLDVSSHWNERHVALCSCAEAHRMKRDADGALRRSLEAISIFPNYPSGHLQMAEAYCLAGNWERSIAFCEQAILHQEMLKREMVCNPTAVQYRPHFLMMYCYHQMGNMQKAAHHGSIAEKAYSEDENFKAISDAIKSHAHASNLARAYMLYRDELIRADRSDEVQKLIDLTPEMIRASAIVSKDTPKVRVKDKPSIAFFCQFTIDHWGPDSIAKGIGGSEEATINMAREMAALGWAPEVYANVEFVGERDGVKWYPWQAWRGDVEEDLDVVVFWRDPNGPKRVGMNSRLAYLWLHDMPSKDQWEPDFESIFDKVIFVSNFHASTHPWVPPEKQFISSNGMDQRLFVPMDDLENNPRRLIWASDPSRGCQLFLPWWETLRERFQDLELHIFYGWSPLFHQHRLQHKHLQKCYESVEKLKTQPGIHWHGRVGQKRLNEEFAKAGFWPYMTEWPEVYCITSIKAQAHGTWPVFTEIASIPEVTRYGNGVPGPMSEIENQAKFIEVLSEQIQSPPTREQRLDMAREIRQITWEGVAREWDREMKAALGSSQENRVVRSGETRRFPSLASMTQK